MTVYHTPPEKATSKKKTNPSIILQAAADNMTLVLRNSSMWHVGLYEDGEIRKTPATIRGNKTYAYYQRQRLEEIQKTIDERVQVEETERTNALFLTLTTQYNPQNADSIDQSWQEVRAALTVFCRRVRRLGVVDYIVGVEAFRGGGCHAHVQLILDRRVSMYKTIDERDKVIYRIHDTTLRNAIKTLWANALKKDIDDAHCDIQAVWSPALCHYITKELKKAGSCEEPLKRLHAGKASEHDEQTVLAYYLARRHKMRLLRVSKGLRGAKPPEVAENVIDLDQDDLMKSCNNFPAYSVFLTRKQIFQYLKPSEVSPFSGSVDKTSREYAFYRTIFEVKAKINDGWSGEMLDIDRDKIERGVIGEINYGDYYDMCRQINLEQRAKRKK